MLAKAIGYLLAHHEIGTFLTYEVTPNWQHPQEPGTLSYIFSVEQTKLTTEDLVYQKMWEMYKDQLKNATTTMLSEMANLMSIGVDSSLLDTEVQKIVDLEFQIATQINTQYAELTQFARFVSFVILRKNDYFAYCDM